MRSVVAEPDRVLDDPSVLPDFSNAPTSDSANEIRRQDGVVCNDGGPTEDSVAVRWIDLPSSWSVVSPGVSALRLAVRNATVAPLPVRLVAIVGNGASSKEGELFEDALLLEPGEESEISITLAEVTLADSRVQNSESLLIRLEFEHPDTETAATVFSPTVFFHPAETDALFFAYGEVALRDLFAGGDYGGHRADSDQPRLEETTVEGEKIVMLGRFVSAD